MFRILAVRCNRIVILCSLIFLSLTLLFLVGGNTRSISEIEDLKSLLITSLNSSQNTVVSDQDPPALPPVSVTTAPPAPAAPVRPEPWLTNSSSVTIWMDLPNAFPWRNCLQEYNDLLIPTDCKENGAQFVLEPVLEPVPEGVRDQERRFVWRTKSGRCITGDNSKVKLSKCKAEKKNKEKEKEKEKKEEKEGSDVWLWTSRGQFQWAGGSGDCPECRKCLTSIKAGAGLELKFCEDLAEDQILEVGTWSQAELAPLDLAEWRLRQDSLRDDILRSEAVVVRSALAEVDLDNSLHEFDRLEENRKRRAAVFYLDKGKGGITMVNWWIFTWRFIGLDTAEEGFDLVFMTHPANVANLPTDCKLVTDSFTVNYTAPGQCLYRPYLGIAYRDKSYDPYMNSQECLYGPGSEFLSQYTLLLRADLDTFPTPHMLSYWPQGVVVDIQYSTNHGLENIKQALRSLACSVGIEHRGWFNMGSTWYGDGRRVRNLARLTVALNKYGRAQMFGPGTECRCPTCHQLPKTCQWGGGPYAGTLLLYLQEIAMNKILTQKEWDTMPKGQLDQGVTDFHRNVCEPVVLHCFHNAELFSKNAFSAGLYRNKDMVDLDMTNERDYATYMALVSSGQGKNSEKMLENLKNKLGNKTWIEYCHDINS